MPVQMAPKRKDSDNGDERNAPKRMRKFVEKGTEEYVAKRERNNLAVKKSRERSREKAAETQDKVERLKSENAHLEQKVQLLQKELSVLKDLFLAHAGSVRQAQCNTDNGSQMKQEDEQFMVNQKAIKNDHEYTNNFS